MAFLLTLLGVFCMWIMWACTFVHQVYPQVRITVKEPEYQVYCPNHYCDNTENEEVYCDNNDCSFPKTL